VNVELNVARQYHSVMKLETGIAGLRYTGSGCVFLMVDTVVGINESRRQ
jgi:NO-binding membrane sensor protein with MHYT domain